MFQFKTITKIFLTCSLVATTIHASQPSMQQRLPTPGLSFMSHATWLKPVAPNKTLHFIAWLKLRNKEQLDQLTKEIYDPNSSNYQQFLTQEVFEQRFAPTKQAEEVVKQYFLSQGMQAQVINHSIRVTGTAKQIEQTFQIQMNHYLYKNNVVYANATAPILSEDVAQYISEISGLDNIPQFQPFTSSKQPITSSHDIDLRWGSFIPPANPTTTSLSGFTGANLQTTYNLQNIQPVSGSHLDGAGQTLVIIDGCGTNSPAQILSDANQYFNANGITPFTTTGSSKNFTIVNPDGTPFTNCANPGDWNGEIALDVESSHTIAPGANTILVLADGHLSTALMDVITTLTTNQHRFAGFSNAYVISNSWGGAESSANPALEASLQVAAASGISINFSSGDCGDFTYSTASKCTAQSKAVNYPASSPYVTAIGGTSLFVDDAWNYAFETVWGTYKNGAYDGGTGGGISQYYGPVSWQSAIYDFTAGGYGKLSANGNRRALPDISMVGDPHTGLQLYEGGAPRVDGGTSLACPLFSSVLILINQARSLLNKVGPIGQAAPYLYQSNHTLLSSGALRLIVPPHQIISGASLPPAGAPLSAFTIGSITYGWDSSLTIAPEDQFWNDAVGVGSPNVPNFVKTMANM